MVIFFSFVFGILHDVQSQEACAIIKHVMRGGSLCPVPGPAGL